MQTKKVLTHEEISRKGGIAFMEKFGKDAYREMGKKSAAGKDREYFSRIGKISAAKRRKKKEQQKRNSLDHVAGLLNGE
ncbi:MAG: hypothetical protein KGJ07_01600 [Patescibacteria group bacterium]|nr:hypothetical protein [Patescibacteria group bacterium]